MTASITVLNKITPPLRWEPKHGVFTEEFLRGKTSDPNGPSYSDLVSGDDSVRSEAQRILGRCLPPTDAAGRETGLVIGYVQSGKTMSFETVISLARDNGYGMVIVFAGTKKNLREQSEERLKKDLGIDNGDNWYHFSNPAENVASQIGNKINAWKKRPDKKKAVLITVLKQIHHLDNLAGVLEDLPLDGIPVLIIDDESDQASLNTHAAKILAQRVASDAKSAIYNKICIVRDKVPHQSYLQYTATPQANLLLNQVDILNPSFAELVTPGGAYTGGKAFFKENPKLIVDIPGKEVPSASNTLDAAPKTLLRALRHFLLVAAQHALTRVRGKDRNRSMMVHPAMQTSSHKLYKDWTDKALQTLVAYVEDQYEDSMSSVERRFQAEYDGLKLTFPDIKPLPELIESMVNDVFGELNCVEINGTPDAERKVDWKQTPYWILVGGAKLDRGYTVEGLCITYMPRPLGNSPAADTLQQRARFFGYKQAYLGLCRIFIQDNVKKAFADYVEHEEFVRSVLEKHRGKPLQEWRRDFILDALQRPTRPNVVGIKTRRILFDGWMVPGALHRDSDARVHNQDVLQSISDSWRTKYGPAINVGEFTQWKSKSNKGLSSHYVLQNVSLKLVLEEFLLSIQVRDPSDAEEHSAILLAMADLLREHKDLSVDVFLMNNLEAQYRTRDAGRGFPKGHKNAPINQYFSNSADSVNDKSFMSSDRLTLQLRRFDLGAVKRSSTSADMRDVTWFALNVPERFKRDTHIESWGSA